MANGVPSATWQANLVNIYNTLTTSGSVVKWLLPFYETSINQSALTTYLTSTWPTQYINTSATAGLAADGTHPNTDGMLYIFETIDKSGVLSAFTKNNSTLLSNSFVLSDNAGRTITSNNFGFTDAALNAGSGNILAIGTGTNSGNATLKTSPFSNAASAWDHYVGGSLAASIRQQNSTTYNTATASEIAWYNGTAFVLGANHLGQLSVAGNNKPTANLFIAGGQAGAGLASMKIATGTLLTTPEDGAIESAGGHIYWTDATPTRWQLDQQSGSSVTASNGLTASVGNVTLGGTLTGNTTIAQASFNTSFTGIGKVTFSPTSTKAGLNVGTVSGVPGTITAGDIYFNSSGIPGVSINSSATQGMDIQNGLLNMRNAGASSEIANDSNEPLLIVGGSELDLTASAGSGSSQSSPIKVLSANSVSANSGTVSISTGNVSTTGNSGNILIAPGTTANGTIGDVILMTNGGHVIIKNIPTSSAGLPSGALWSNLGVLTIVP